MTQSPPFSNISAATVNHFIEGYPNSVIFTDPEGCIIFANKKTESIFGIPADAMTGKSIMTLIAPGRVQQEMSAFRAIVQSKNLAIAGDQFETIGINNKGKAIPLEVSFNILRDSSTPVIFCVLRDISKRVELQKELYHRAITDPLTGLFNRRHFNERLTQEFKRTARYRRPFSAIIIDIDGFKQANDIHGHQFGDEMLIKATRLFQSALRQGDTVYRYGGDEFAMLLPETCKENSIDVAERLKQDFSKCCASTDHRIKLSLSIGIASYPEDGSDEKSLMSAADTRMYSSKEKGGNLITAYDDMNSDTEVIIRTLANLIHIAEKNRGIHVTLNDDQNHSQSIRALALEIGLKLELSHDKLCLLEQASMLHDVGFIYVPSETLRKSSELNADEWRDIKRHPLIGEEIIEAIRTGNNGSLVELKNVIGQHHEHIDGSGYPRGLIGEEIMLEAKILAVSDAYSAMLSNRPHRSALQPTAALDELKRLAGTHYDSDIVDLLVEIETQH